MARGRGSPRTRGGRANAPGQRRRSPRGGLSQACVGGSLIEEVAMRAPGLFLGVHHGSGACRIVAEIAAVVPETRSTRRAAVSKEKRAMWTGLRVALSSIGLAGLLALVTAPRSPGREEVREVWTHDGQQLFGLKPSDLRPTKRHRVGRKHLSRPCFVRLASFRTAVRRRPSGFQADLPGCSALRLQH